jgi:hypothetical protein
MFCLDKLNNYLMLDSKSKTNFEENENFSKFFKGEIPKKAYFCEVG